MKILVIIGDCILTNSSANLCHTAYIRGLVDAGHSVTLLSADGKDYTLDESVAIPTEVVQYTYYGVSLYEKLSLRKRAATAAAEIASSTMSTAHGAHFASDVKHKLKNLIRSWYGPHGIYASFIKKAQKFKSSEEFDYVLSISTPPSSHLLAHNLLKSGHIKGNHWIQIWEDPWHNDVYGFQNSSSIRREEQRLLSFAEKICYVSPLTLKYQQEKYPESAHKMYWQPLPFYYKADLVHAVSFDQNYYGYFGDYAPAARNLAPFFEAAKASAIKVNICGNPCNLFPDTEHIHIHPRLSLNELKPIEDSTNVLIFLCNRKGGQIPGKIYQYSATNKTILFIMDGTLEEQKVLREFFGQFNRYVFCQNTVEDITRAIRQIESGNLGDVRNVPLNDFDPVKTITNILDAGR